MVAVTTIRTMTQVTKKTIRVGLTKTNWTNPHAEKMTTTLVADKLKVGFICYSICQNDRYNICLASANQMKVNNQQEMRAVGTISFNLPILGGFIQQQRGGMSIKFN